GEPSGRFLEMVQPPVEAQPEEVFAARAKCAARRQSHARFVHDLDRGPRRVLHAVDREKEVEGTVRSGKTHATGFAENAGDYVSSLPGTFNLPSHKAVALIEGGNRTPLHELRYAGRGILDEVFEDLLK